MERLRGLHKRMKRKSPAVRLTTGHGGEDLTAGATPARISVRRAFRTGAILLALAGCGAAAWVVGQRPDPAAPAPAAVAAASTGPEEVGRLLEEEARSGDPSALLELALFRQSTGDDRAALEGFQSLSRRHPTFARGRHYLGLAYLALGRAAEAYPEFLAESRLAPRDAQARVYLGMSVQALGRVAEATRQYLEAQRLEPDAPTAYFALAQLDNGPAGYPRALQNLERYIARTAQPAPGYELMSRIYAHKGEREAALKYARMAVESDSANATYWHHLGRLYHEMSGPEKLRMALACYDEAARRRPRDGEIWFDYGRGFATAHQWPQAIAAFERCRAAGPPNGELYYHLGRALQAAGRGEEARRELALFQRYRAYLARRAPIQKAIGTRPDEPGLRLQLAAVCLEFRQYSAARQAISEARALAPSDSRIRARSGDLLARLAQRAPGGTDGADRGTQP